MLTVKQFLAQTKSPVSRGLPCSRKLHSLEVRRRHIVEKRDWFDAKIESATEKSKGDKTLFNRALAGIYAAAEKFAPWRKKREG